ncbi:Granule-bound starch synthase 1, chloroplastic/amyloplastic-like protein [Drosera capensis]
MVFLGRTENDIGSAALEAPRALSLNNSPYFSGPYGEDVIFIANDWHSALVPCYLKANYKSRGLYKNARAVFCIHNTLYQGRYAYSDFRLLNLPEEMKASFDFMDGYKKPVVGRKINWMKAGILEADRVLTVSPYYAKEIGSSAVKGVELDKIINRAGITGIINGMDVQEWNPSTDKFIDVKYDAATVMEAKPLLKESLQAAVGLPVDRNIPVIGFIGRLEEQKGSDILVATIPQFIKENVQIIVLGTGKEPMEKQVRDLEMKYPDKARGVTKFNAQLAHMITAGADFMLVTSRFEPCGLIQLYAMRYGTLPIVASTGGLVDTVKEGITGFQMGSFNSDCEVVDPADVAAVATGVTRALETFGTPVCEGMIRNCMDQDLSWKGSSKQWEEILLSLDVTGSVAGLEANEIAPLAQENVPAP